MVLLTNQNKNVNYRTEAGERLWVKKLIAEFPNKTLTLCSSYHIQKISATGVVRKGKAVGQSVLELSTR